MDPVNYILSTSIMGTLKRKWVVLSSTKADGYGGALELRLPLSIVFREITCVGVPASEARGRVDE